MIRFQKRLRNTWFEIVIDWLRLSIESSIQRWSKKNEKFILRWYNSSWQRINKANSIKKRFIFLKRSLKRKIEWISWAYESCCLKWRKKKVAS